MSNILVEQASGALHVSVARSQRISPHMQRVTLTGDDLARLQWRGFDQWVRIFLPTDDPSSLEHVPRTLTRGSYMRLQAVPARRRPVVRSYTLRNWRPETRELDIDFVVHGTDGVAGPWALAAKPGDRLALIDQGCGWPQPGVDSVVLVADETGLPAVLGILRDLPRTARGLALIEVPDAEDAQPTTNPDGVEVRWLIRDSADVPGRRALAELVEAELAPSARHAFCVGEAGLATGARRHLVRERGWDRADVTFCGYWKR